MTSDPGRRSGRLLLTFVVVLAATLVTGPLAHGTADSYLRLAHLSPDTPSVDVTVTPFQQPEQARTFPGVGYGTVSDYQRVPSGTYTVAMRPAGAPPTVEPVIATTVQAGVGRAYTVAGLGGNAALALRVLDDDITPPPAGQARMRVVNAAPSTGTLDVGRSGATLIERAEFGTATPYTVVPAGSEALGVRPANGTGTELPVDLQPGGVYSVLVLERDGALTAAVRTDAKGAQVVPAGGIQTGLGGAADDAPTAWWAIAVAAALGLAVLVRRRTRAS